MTSAERQASSRENREREDLVEKYIKAVKHGLTEIVGFGEKRDKDREAQKKYVRRLTADATALSIECLRKAIEALEANKDAEGRLHNERSGEGKRKYGMSELERITAARDRDEDGRRVTPQGQGATQFEVDMTGDSADTAAPKSDSSRAYVINRLDHELEERAKDEKIAEVARQVFVDISPTAESIVRVLRCKLCGFKTGLWNEAADHVWNALGTGFRLQDRYLSLLEDDEGDISAIDPEGIVIGEARGRLVSDKHFGAITTLLRRRPRKK